MTPAQILRLELRYRDHARLKVGERRLQPLQVRGTREIARSVSRLNSAAPYSAQACPPMSRARTRFCAIEERTLRIGFGIKRASEGEVGRPQLCALGEALSRGQAVPVGPFRSGQRFGA